MPISQDTFLKGLRAAQHNIDRLTQETDAQKAYHLANYQLSELLPWFAEYTGSVDVINFIEQIIESYEIVAKRAGVNFEELEDEEEEDGGR